MPEQSWILTLDCQDRVGIVAAVGGFLAAEGGFILDSQQYADLEAGRFFMRVEFKASGPPLNTDGLRTRFEPLGRELGLEWAITDAVETPRALIAVSRASHCLNDLLHRWSTGSLGVDIVGVVSNHDKLRGLAEWHGLPFELLPDGKAGQEAAMLDRMEETAADYLILARYMQVLSDATAGRLAGRCINIHHSFLPGFKGAKPYHRAHARGVKLIGATAHFVTGDLDEGPIIEQAVERVDHRATVDDMIRIGRDIEAQVLARAVQWVGARRVFVNGLRTLVFR